MTAGRTAIAGLVLLCGIAAPSPAHSRLECRELADTLNVLTDIEITVFLPDEIDGEEDELLRFIAATARDAADAERDRRLNKAANKMRRAYRARDLAGFKRGLERAVDRLEVIRDRDC